MITAQKAVRQVEEVSENQNPLKNYSTPCIFLPLLLLFNLQLVRANHKQDIHGQDPGGDVDEHAGEVEADEGHHDVDHTQDKPDPAPDDPRLH